MSTISAGTAAGTALVTSGDTTGQLVFQTNGTTTALTLGTDQSATFAGNVTVTGSFSSTAGLTSPVTVAGNSTAGAEIRLPEDTDNGSNYVAIKAPNSLASNLTFTLPSADGTNGQFLQTNGSGTLAFATPTSGGMTLLSQFNPTNGQTQFEITNIPASSKLIRLVMLQTEVSASGTRINIAYSTDNGSTYGSTTSTATTGGGTIMAGYYDFSGVTLSGVRKLQYGFTVGSSAFSTNINSTTGVANAMRFTLEFGTFNGTGTILIYAFI